LSWLWALQLLGAAYAQPAPQPLLQLRPDNVPVLLQRYTPAGGPLQRFTSRPGAWYVALFLAAPPQWPVEFMVMPRHADHELTVFALDTDAAGEVNSVTRLPMSYQRAKHRGVGMYVGDFVLPAGDSVGGVVLLLEQWSPSGQVPQPIWVNAHLAFGHPSTANDNPWWSLPPAAKGHEHAAPALEEPPSPLRSQGQPGAAYEIPLRQTPPSPTLDPYSAR
jgi:hypothetical protein